MQDQKKEKKKILFTNQEKLHVKRGLYQTQHE